MAKKTSSKPKATAKADGPTAQEIVDLCEKAATVPLDDAGKTWTARALSTLRTKFKVAVQKRLNKKGNWTVEGPKVLKVATAMGQIAVILSDTDTTVNKAIAHAAFKAAKSHQACPGGSGGGAWCEFQV